MHRAICVYTTMFSWDANKAISNFEKHGVSFEEAAAVIEQNREFGGPMGPHMFAYLAAANAMAGNEGKAFAFAEKVRSDDSGFPVETFVRNVLSDQEAENQLISALTKAGLDLSNL